MTNRMAVNDVELDWRQYGDRESDQPTLVLCHGYTGSLTDFSLQAEQLAADTRRRVVSLTQRGHGDSTRCGNLESYSFDILTDDLITFIEQSSPGRPVELLGHSMGGRVALGVVLARPDLINSLILMDTSAWSFVPENEKIRTLIAKFMDRLDPAKGVPNPRAFDLGGPEVALIEAIVPEQQRAQR